MAASPAMRRTRALAFGASVPGVLLGAILTLNRLNAHSSHGTFDINPPPVRSVRTLLPQPTPTPTPAESTPAAPVTMHAIGACEGYDLAKIVAGNYQDKSALQNVRSLAAACAREKATGAPKKAK